MAEASNSLAEVLRREMSLRGAIPFRDFMAHALYHPEFGYYTSGRARIGRDGDFFTNVSVGALFGRLLARQFAEIWERLGWPEEFTVVEQGAHRGELAADVLAALQTLNPACLATTVYRIVEPAPALRAAQANTLGAAAEKVRWVPSLSALPPFTGVHFSNELIDALPVHLVSWTGAAWVERHVDFADGSFHFVDGPAADPAVIDRLALLPEPVPGYQTEIHIAALDWVTELAAKITRGCVLAIDYGFSRAEYYRPERTAGTLSAYAGHRREPDPLARPGELDLTAHVDFTSLVEAGESAGLRLAGFTDQHHFIVGLGRLHFPDDAADSPEMRQELRAFKTLMHPNLLGHSFKALALAKGMADPAPLAGFSLARDARQSLGI